MNDIRDEIENFEHPPESDEMIEEEQPWLVSYADMMTLLFGLFAMMFSFATFDQTAYKRFTKAINKTFGALSAEERSHKLATDIKTTLIPKMDHVEIVQKDNNVEIQFTNSVLFESGKANLAKSALPLMETLANEIKATGTDLDVRVEGHTDDNPIATSQFPSNWELSSARAASIVHFFESVHFPPDHLEAIGYGSARPLAANRNEDGKPIAQNQAKNRRVLIKITLPD